MCSINTFDQNTRNHLTPTSIWALQPISEKMRLFFSFSFSNFPILLSLQGLPGPETRVETPETRVETPETRVETPHEFLGAWQPMQRKERREIQK
jgi:hypothetical protein